ncbi:antibiotic biosynthesis monooxygenase [uncultured Marivita sp.]|uniref:antibiotic biosynthesis monooxygenase n=1 Tax=uncultured Marivita sp. TaxID=888080 RepID=UPI00260F99CE|nr:antibiotic biosynthesis monooxygenase [uncultured Marivita sp.]
MFQAAFMFRPGQTDAEFDAFTAQINACANRLDGFLGEENWRSPDGTIRLAIYYWEDRACLDAFVRDPVHRQAKARQAEWYNGYHVIMSKVISTYGDERLPHVTGDSRRKRTS